jgi:hypothetical protein
MMPLEGTKMPVSPKMVKKTLFVPEKEFERFKKRFPMRGAFVWFVREALRCHNDINDVDQTELMMLAVGEIKVTED